MSEYTPTTKDVREVWIYAQGPSGAAGDSGASSKGEPSGAQLKAGAQEYAAQRYREVIYLSEYNAAVSAFVEGVEWVRAAGGAR